MKRITILVALFISFSLTAAEQMVIYDHKAPQALKNALNAAKATGKNIEKLIFTKDNHWFLGTETKRWYSSPSYFKNLKGSGNVGLWNRLEADARQGKKLQSLGITNRGNWVVVYKDGSVVTSSARAFTNNGLIPKVNQIRNNNSKVVKVFLGPAGSWILGDVHARLYTNNLPQDLRLLIESIEESRLRLADMAFRLRDNNEFHWAVTAGGNYWKSGAPGSRLWRSLEFMDQRSNMINSIALQSGDGFSLISQFKWRPGAIDVLSNIEKNVGGNRLYQRMRHHKVPGLVLAHIRKGRLWDVRPYGYRKTYKHYPMNSFARFPVASLSKAVASAAILKGEEERLFDLDDTFKDFIDGDSSLTTAQTWFDSLTQSRKNLIDGARLKSFLGHTAGLNIHGIGSYLTNSTIPSLEDIIFGRNGRAKLQPVRTPEVIYDYSGGGYSLIESMVEQTTGQDFWRYTYEKILQPVGMTRSTMRGLSRAAQTNYVEGHENNKGVGYRVCPGKAAGGLFSTAFDYSKFMIMLSHLGKVGPRSTDKRVLSERTVRRMMTSVDRANVSSNRFCRQDSECSNPNRCIENRCIFPVTDRWGWNFGLGLKMTGDRLSNGLPRFVEHGGTHKGLQHKFRIYNSGKDALLILTNGECDWEFQNRDGSKEERGACSLINEIMTSFHNKI